MSTDSAVTGTELARRWQELRTQNPRVRARDAAAQLGVSEAELVASGIGSRVRRLRPEWPALLHGLEAVGAVTTITRNEQCVHERNGVWQKVEVDAHHALVLDEGIDLRLFPRAWRHAFALEIEGPRDLKRSVQIFDAAGMAVIKIFVGPNGDVAAFDALAASLAHAEQSADLTVEPPPAAERTTPDADVDAAGLRAAWRELKDTHDFFPLLRRFKVARAQAMRLAEPDMAWPAPKGAFRELLTAAAAAKLPVMIFVGNPGAIQIHTGPVVRVEDVGPWLNVLDPDFNLHLREGEIAESWAVRKPTVDGIVTSLELFDAAGSPILQMFGKRKPGIPESLEWRALLERVIPPRVPGDVGQR